MAVNLTETAIKAAMKKATETGVRLNVADAGLPGLWLRLSPSGGRAWVLSCRDTFGATRRFPLGQHPAMGISEARDAARSMREAVRGGADPIADARRKRMLGKQAREGVGTLKALLDLYGEREGFRRKSWVPCRRMVEHVFSVHLGKPLATLKLGDLQLTADTHKAQQSAAAAVRYLRPVIKWAAHTGRSYVSSSLAAITPPATVKRRDRVLTTEELGKLLPVLRESTRSYGRAMRFMLLTLARREEVCGARWKDINFENATWTIAETKNGQAHVVPLSRQAVALLRATFGENAAGEKTTADDTSRIFSTSSGAGLGNWHKEARKIMERSKTHGWTRHDLRRTGATLLGNLGELPDIIEASLNHAAIRSTLAATYNRSRYRPQVAAALQRLADELDRIEEGPSNVITLRRPA